LCRKRKKGSWSPCECDDEYEDEADVFFLFFDCNIGAYKIMEANLRTFFQKYKQIYADSWPEWKIGQTLCYDVSPVS
jgi:hypothetical protein